MNQEQAENAVTLSALVTGGIFAYRKAVEPGIKSAGVRRAEGKGGVASQNLIKDYKSLFGAAPPIEWGQWLKAAGVLYISLSIIAAASPEIGGYMAILVGTSAVIGNGIAVTNDLKAEPGESTAERAANTKTASGATVGQQAIKSGSDLTTAAIVGIQTGGF
jgi:hypothetical protein